MNGFNSTDPVLTQSGLNFHASISSVGVPDDADRPSLHGLLFDNVQWVANLYPKVEIVLAIIQVLEEME